MNFTWNRYGGYECSSAGDKRFSAFCARLPDGRSIEQHYQCDLKGYDPGGTRWQLGKGKPARDGTSGEVLYLLYLALWRVWAEQHRPLLEELRQKAVEAEYVLSDRFATSEINQARALADLLNEPMPTIPPLPDPARAVTPKPAEPSVPKLSPAEAYQALFEPLELIGAHSDAYYTFHQKHEKLFLGMPASIKGHHCFPGGYAVHICEVVTTLVRLVRADMYPAARRVDLGQAIIAAYIHDLDKLLIRYVRDTKTPSEAQRKKAFYEKVPVAPNETMASLSVKIDAAVNGHPMPSDAELPRHGFNPAFPAVDDSAAVMFLCLQHGLPGVTWDIVHAVSLHHGGYSALARTSPYVKASPLALLLHAADQISAGIQMGDT